METVAVHVHPPSVFFLDKTVRKHIQPSVIGVILTLVLHITRRFKKVLFFGNEPQFSDFQVHRVSFMVIL